MKTFGKHCELSDGKTFVIGEHMRWTNARRNADGSVTWGNKYRWIEELVFHDVFQDAEGSLSIIYDELPRV
jgi:hypothetical protein